MSEQHSHPGHDGPDEELEALLKKLEPTSLDPDLMARLQRDHEAVSTSNAYDSTRVHWRRVIPLTLACCAVMAGYIFYQSRPPQEEPQPIVAERGPVPVETTSSIERFEPVSAQGYLINTSSGGVVHTEEGPQEKMELEYRDAYHWRDPQTGTNIRFFQPRKEELIVPIPTD